MTGQKIGWVTVGEYLGHGEYACVCDCGKHFTQKTNKLRHGRVTSCGCKRSDSDKKLKWGLTHTSSANTSGYTGVVKRRWGYEAWANMGGKRKYLGVYKTAEEAYQTRRHIIESYLNEGHS